MTCILLEVALVSMVYLSYQAFQSTGKGGGDLIALFAHNQEAYTAAAAMLKERGKAAIIHPTGTGKSFIGFKLCEDHPEARVCWLSPSAYIFETQLENLKAAGAEPPGNIRFLTYARLMQMSDGEVAAIEADYLILDEFHRCGARMWGGGVRRLLARLPRAAILGLSATNIRYLDNRRDMADELFDGNVASEMTLGEAIVRGILRAPRYVLSVYAYQAQLDRCARRVRAAKSPAVRDRAAQCLEALRRALGQADGLDAVFARHMPRRDGKYLVFCTGLRHMEEMRQKASEWFSQVDPAPHTYWVYANNAASKEAFARFKADQSSHLKLLYCIDMLNEGVHVDDISGVILLRPTVSPTVYKQQIGRALSASRKADAVIFDIVLNIENLYSIGALEEEMRLAVDYYRAHDMEGLVVQEHFRIFDEVRNCRALFDALNDALSASWETMYQAAKAYYDRFGHLEVPKRYRTAEGYSLGNWIAAQRRVRAGEAYGRLSDAQIAKLDEIGMIWGNWNDYTWSRNYQAAKAYFERYGTLDVPADYVTETGLPLGSWIANLRTCRRSQSRRQYLTPQRIAELDAIGMVWRVSDRLWERYWAACTAYRSTHPNLDVPSDYVTEDGIRLGAWIRSIRTARRNPEKYGALSPERVEALDRLGMVWDKASNLQWEQGYVHASEYREAHGHLQVPAAYVAADGYRLGRWIARQRENPNLADGRRQRLDALGMVWKQPDGWAYRYRLAQRYRERHGHLDVPADFVEDGVWLGKWLEEQRQIYLGKRPGKVLTDRQIRQLEQLGMQWAGKQERAWEEQYAQARQYYEAHGNLEVPSRYQTCNGKRLDLWLARQRQYQRAGKLTATQVERLNQIGMIWRSNSMMSP